MTACTRFPDLVHHQSNERGDYYWQLIFGLPIKLRLWSKRKGRTYASRHPLHCFCLNFSTIARLAKLCYCIFKLSSHWPIELARTSHVLTLGNSWRHNEFCKRRNLVAFVQNPQTSGDIGACANSVYKALFPSPAFKESLGTRLGSHYVRLTFWDHIRKTHFLGS